jgi:hypothetical protein
MKMVPQVKFSKNISDNVLLGACLGISKTISGKGRVQYVMSPSFFLDLLACSHG